MVSCNCSVQQAVRKALSVGQELETPARRSVFVIQSLDDLRGIKINKLAGYISWGALNGVPSYIASLGGEVAIGAINGKAAPGTLESFLQQAHGDITRRSNYVVPILEEAGVVDILPKVGNEKQRIRLTAKWNPRS